MLALLRPFVRAAVPLSLLLLALETAHAQVAPGWIATYEDPLHPQGYDAANACTGARNGDVYIATFSMDYPVQSAAFLKYDVNGSLLWKRSYAPFDANYSYAFEAPSGGALFVGRIESVATILSDFVVTRLDAAGNLVWTDTYAAQVIQQDYYRSVVDTAGNVVIVGTHMYHDWSYIALFVRSYSPTGTLNFHTESTAISWPRLEDIAALGNGGVVAVGTDFGSNGGFVAAFSSNGALAWSQTVPGSAQSVAVDPLTGSIAIASSAPTATGYSAAVRCLDEAGNPLWLDIVDDPALDSAGIYTVAFASDGALWAVGNAMIAGGVHELALRYDGSGARTVTRVGVVRGEAAWNVMPGAAGQVWTSVAEYSRGRARVQQLDVLGQLNWRFELARHSGFSLAGIAGGRIVASGATGVSDSDAIVQQIDVRESPDGYCTAQVNSLGCTPALTFAGNASASEASDFVVSVARVINRKTGLFFYGTSGGVSVPFHGGTLCVAGPVARRALLSTGGSPSPANDCSGALSIDLDALASDSPALLQPGTTVCVQAWSHDPAAPSTTNLSSALHFVVLP